ncbi:MAG: hypothetical protein QM767_28010 [Anaeromyxobacter sp.]
MKSSPARNCERCWTRPIRSREVEAVGEKGAGPARQGGGERVFEDSTRTRTSFALAAQRLGADVIDFSEKTSSTSKGETLVDTAPNIEAMGIDVMVVRHQAAGAAALLYAQPQVQRGERRQQRTTNTRRRACWTLTRCGSDSGGSKG